MLNSVCSSLTREQSNALYLQVLTDKDKKAIRELCLKDLFFLLTVACKRKDMDRDWLYARCREVESNPDGYLDLWAREHYKSTCITFGKTIQDILNNPNITVGIFSHTRPIAKAFLEQIKRELESNDFLQDIFPDVLYKEPHKDSPKWSLDSGIIVKRTQNPKECTVEAWGLVDGQPTSKHFSLLVYDDVVTRESVNTPEQIDKTTDALALSYNLGAEGGTKRFIGTRYHYNDSYKTLIERKTAIPRIYPATDNGTIQGNPVLMSRETLLKKYSDMGVYVFSSQMLQNPASDKAMSFKSEWIMYYNELKSTKNWNHYILVDPAGEKKKGSDYTVIAVVALAPDKNYYLIDAVRDRLNLNERTKKLFEFVRKYNPICVGYEKYGLQSDIEHIKYVMEIENFRFRIMPLGGAVAKNSRIRGISPIFENNRFWFPHRLNYIDYENNVKDFIIEFKKEYESFPVSEHDDILDCLARIVDADLFARFPKPINLGIDGISITHINDINKTSRDYALIPTSKSRDNKNRRSLPTRSVWR